MNTFQSILARKSLLGLGVAAGLTVIPFFFCFLITLPPEIEFMVLLKTALAWTGLMTILFLALLVLPPLHHLHKHQKTAGGDYIKTPSLWLGFMAFMACLLLAAYLYFGGGNTTLPEYIMGGIVWMLLIFVFTWVPVILGSITYWVTAIRTEPANGMFIGLILLFIIWNLEAWLIATVLTGAMIN